MHLPGKLLLQASLLCIYLGHASWAQAHGGGLDKDGGHVERSTGFYHCHREPCFRIHGDTVGPLDQLGPSSQESGSAPFVTLYIRDDWPHWNDDDGDCQDARAETLIRHSLIDVSFRESNNCSVESGFWSDPYTGQLFRDASEIDIDHTVPLQWAHGHGGDRWTARQKQTFANDLQNLLPVSASVNRQKGAKGPDDWLPPRKEFQCEYLRKFISIVQAYGLRFVEVEAERLKGIVRACGLADTALAG
ncbi:MAG: HNH endonuclease [Pseudohongiellaceae bacterium]